MIHQKGVTELVHTLDKFTLQNSGLLFETVNEPMRLVITEITNKLVHDYEEACLQLSSLELKLNSINLSLKLISAMLIILKITHYLTF